MTRINIHTFKNQMVYTIFKIVVTILVYCEIQEKEVDNDTAKYCASFIPNHDFNGERKCSMCEWGRNSDDE